MDTTSIHALPSDPMGGSMPPSLDQNISVSIRENQSNLQNTYLPDVGDKVQPPSISLDQNVIHQIIDGIQKASLTGVTQLPSRDIPQTTETLTRDPHIQPNYIQPVDRKDYIKEYEDKEDISNKYQRQENRKDRLDDLYNDLQIPILLAVLYFLFQLPFFRRALFKYVPILFGKDGNMNLQGFLFTSGLFGGLFYTLQKVLT
jgi:hypothetical protein